MPDLSRWQLVYDAEIARGMTPADAREMADRWAVPCAVETTCEPQADGKARIDTLSTNDADRVASELLAQYAGTVPDDALEAHAITRSQVEDYRARFMAVTAEFYASAEIQAEQLVPASAREVREIGRETLRYIRQHVPSLSVARVVRAVCRVAGMPRTRRHRRPSGTRGSPLAQPSSSSSDDPEGLNLGPGTREVGRPERGTSTDVTP